MKVVNDSVDSKSNIVRWKQQVKSKRKAFDTIPDVHPTPRKKSRAEDKKVVK